MTSERTPHLSRSWNGAGHLEATCPCGKAPCGMVDGDLIDPACLEHPLERMKTIRTMHWSDTCPKASS